MSRVIPRIAAAVAVASVVAGCGLRWFEQREPWRNEAELACIKEGLVTPGEHVRPASEIDGAGACGMTRPFKVSALADGFVAVKPQATLACPIIPQLQSWVAESIQPAAMRWFGQPVVEMRQMSSYSCRGQNGQAGAKISEHAFGNALDIGSFKLADERVVSVRDHWSRGTPEEKGFLREVAGAACKRFTTVLGPGSNVFHYDHIHVDLARRKSRDICKPGVLPTGGLGGWAPGAQPTLLPEGPASSSAREAISSCRFTTIPTASPRPIARASASISRSGRRRPDGGEGDPRSRAAEGDPDRSTVAAAPRRAALALGMAEHPPRRFVRERAEG
ncbi:MAG: extensin family protein, partial [Bacteroidales bacterium]|nr:extensin family protein [Bacteroidales bacterium]